jgi:hypothetical protein
LAQEETEQIETPLENMMRLLRENFESFTESFEQEAGDALDENYDQGWNDGKEDLGNQVSEKMIEFRAYLTEIKDTKTLEKFNAIFTELIYVDASYPENVVSSVQSNKEEKKQ